MGKKLQKNKKIVLLLLLLVISLGYALLSATLTINGSSKIQGQSWDIHWNNVQVTTGSVAVGTEDKAAVITPNDNTEVTYEVSLSKPGDFYEFTVDAVNAGSIDAMIDVITSTYKIGEGEVTPITSSNLPAYLDYSVSYSDGEALAQYQELKANTTETYKVRVEFKRDIDENDLPSTAQSIVFSFAVDYVQADSNATAINHQMVGPTLPVDLDAYAVTREEIDIGKEIPDGVNLRSTPVEAMVDWASLTGTPGDTYPVFLGYKLGTGVTTGLSNVPVEHYIGIFITDELKSDLKNEYCNNVECEAQYNALVNGAYLLRGSVAGYLEEDDEIFYEENKSVIEQVFGELVSDTSVCQGDDNNFGCSLEGISMNLNEYWGYASINVFNRDCSAEAYRYNEIYGGRSNCS